ncbi:hypothetical protein [Streptomyces cucumeris]|uniref:hypothetical protein n=1 Tax=Streptomyces cucumeris TaxID=2962890 RepID=UPI003D73DABC
MSDHGGNDRPSPQTEAGHAAAQPGIPNLVPRALGVLVLWLTGGALFLLNRFLPLGTADCDYEQHAACDPSTLDLAMAIPDITIPLAVLAGTWGLFSRRPGVAPLAWISSILAIITSTGAAFAIAT